MADKIVLPNTFEASRIKFSEPKILDNGGKSIFLGYDYPVGWGKFMMQTPKMSIPFGWNDEAIKNNDYSLNPSFRGVDQNKVVKTFFDNMKAFDDLMVTLGHENRQSWLKQKDATKDVISALYSPIIRYPKDKNGEITDKYPPTIKIRLPYKDNKFVCKFFDEKGNTIDGSKIDFKGCVVSILFQASSVWFAMGKFGVTFKAEQVMVIQTPTRLKDFAFQPLEGEDSVPRDIEEHSDDDNDHTSEKSENEEIEESEDDLEEEPPVPVKPTIKKPTVKK